MEAQQAKEETRKLKSRMGDIGPRLAELEAEVRTIEYSWNIPKKTLFSHILDNMNMFNIQNRRYIEKMLYIARVERQTAQPDHRPGKRDVRHAERARPWERQERREDRRPGEQPGGGHPGTPGPPGRQAVPGAGDQLLQEAARDRGEQV